MHWYFLYRFWDWKHIGCNYIKPFPISSLKVKVKGQTCFDTVSLGRWALMIHKSSLIEFCFYYKYLRHDKVKFKTPYRMYPDEFILSELKKNCSLSCNCSVFFVRVRSAYPDEKNYVDQRQKELKDLWDALKVCSEDLHASGSFQCILMWVQGPVGLGNLHQFWSLHCCHQLTNSCSTWIYIVSFCTLL